MRGWPSLGVTQPSPAVPMSLDGPSCGAGLGLAGWLTRLPAVGHHLITGCLDGLGSPGVCAHLPEAGLARSYGGGRGPREEVRHVCAQSHVLLVVSQSRPLGRCHVREPMKQGCRGRNTKWSSPGDEGARRFLGASICSGKLPNETQEMWVLTVVPPLTVR